MSCVFGMAGGLILIGVPLVISLAAPGQVCTR
jgi:hypothetical protein